MNPGFTSILVSVTEGCHVGCAHCGFIGSSRERSTELEELEKWVGQACDYGIPSTIFTGGEPFERLDALRLGVAAAHRRGVPSAIFTSSFWATSRDLAARTLEQLPGLRHLYLSTDTYHQRRVPREHVKNVIEAAETLGIPEVTLCVTYSTERDRLAVRGWYEAYAGRVRFHESRVIPTRFISRAVRDQDPPLEALETNFGVRCWLKTPIINPNGDVFACHAGKVGAHGNAEELPYWLGNLRGTPFAEIMAAARQNVEYQFLRTHGPKGIARLFAEYPSLREEIGRSAFTGPCDLCFSTLSTAAGRRSLTEYAHRPEVRQRINARLALRHREPPMDS